MTLTPPLPRPARPNGKTVEAPRCVARYPHGPDGQPVRCDDERDHRTARHGAVLPPLPGRDDPRLWSWF